MNIHREIDQSEGEEKPNIVTFGGGSGSELLFAGMDFDQYGQVTGIVSSSDSGGSSGVLSIANGLVAVGDARRIVEASLRGENADDLRASLAHRLMINGVAHPRGNLDLISEIMRLGSVEAGIGFVAAQFGVPFNVQILPVSDQPSHLIYRPGNGDIDVHTEHVIGNTYIDSLKKPEIQVRRIEEDGTVAKGAEGYQPTLLPSAKEAIVGADVIVIAPGSLITSLAAVLGAGGIRDTFAEAKDNGAKILQVVNLDNAGRHTEGFNAHRFIAEVNRYIGLEGAVDLALVNSNQQPAGASSESNSLTPYDEEALDDVVEEFILADLLGERQGGAGGDADKSFYAHHQKNTSVALAGAISTLAYQQ